MKHEINKGPNDHESLISYDGQSFTRTVVKLNMPNERKHLE